MGAWEFQGEQWFRFGPSIDYNPHPCVTVEALCSLLDAGQDSTVFCRPAGRTWSPPYVVWRLGFYSNQRLPEFQILFRDDSSPVTVRAEDPIPLYEVVHLAGVYDGQIIKLYVNGQVAASKEKRGLPAESEQEIVVGVRSATDRGGYLVARLFDLRYWQVPRESKDVDFWRTRTLPVPTPDGCVGYWHTGFKLPSDTRQDLLHHGFSAKEVSFFSFLNHYAVEYPEIAARLPEVPLANLYPSTVHATVILRASDGYLVFYEPHPAEYLEHLAGLDMAEPGSIVVSDQPERSVSEAIQGLTGNAVKMALHVTHNGEQTIPDFPQDNPKAVDWMLSRELRACAVEPPRIRILAAPTSRGSDDDDQKFNRTRLIAPTVTLDDGKLIRAFTWLFADLWLGELNWDHAIKGAAEALAFNDALAVRQFSEFVHSIDRSIQIDPRQLLLPIENRIREFEELISQEDVEEVRDILPFLRKPENWFLLSPTCEHVWPEKQLGHKYRVDFVVREPGNQYTAVEIESPTKRLYKIGAKVEPYEPFHHAEGQVRDYCNFIDRNLDYVQREEGLAGIFKPKGIVVIGRRATLSPAGAKKLEERNRDSSRYTIKTFDDLIDEANSLVQRLRQLI